MPFLHHQQRMLRIVGYDLRSHESLARQLFTGLNLVLLYAIMYPEARYVTDNIADIRRATDGLCPLLFGFSSAARLLTLRVRRERFYSLILRLQAMWKRTDGREADCGLLRSAFKRENRLTFPYAVSTCMVGVLYLSFPLIRASYQHWHSGGANATWVMPMRSSFWYDISGFPNYELTYTWFVQSTFLCAIGATGIDALFYAGAFNLSAHFQIIQRHAERIQYGQRHPTLLRSDRLQLVTLIEQHRRTIELARFMTETYQPILLCQFAVSSVQICVIAYQLTLPNVSAQSYLTYTTFMLTIGFQCFVYCHGGTRLETESEAVANALYGGRWYETDVQTQQCMRFCMQRAQKPVVVRSVFFSANLETCSTIFRTAGSYIALLQTISGK